MTRNLQKENQREEEGSTETVQQQEKTTKREGQIGSKAGGGKKTNNRIRGQKDGCRDRDEEEEEEEEGGGTYLLGEKALEGEEMEEQNTAEQNRAATIEWRSYREGERGEGMGSYGNFI